MSGAGAVLVAAGAGRRLGPGGPPKQFRSVGGAPLFVWPLRVLDRSPDVSTVVVVVPSERRAWVERVIRKARLKKVHAVVAGGAERADSVRRGIDALPAGCDVILIHDAARALVSPDVVKRVVRGVRHRGAALAAWPVPDTLKESRGEGGVVVQRTLPRAGMWLAQTPQGFLRKHLPIFLKATGPMTDDVMALERAGVPVELVMGSPLNFKVTRPDDFKLCRAVFLSRGKNKK